MDNKKRIADKIEAALSSLDGLQRAEPNPFFYTRVQARLNREEPGVWERIGGFITRPAIVFAGLCALILLNIGIASFDLSTGNTAKNDLQDQSINVYYNPPLASLYDYETDQR